MKEILLTREMAALVDDEDYDYLNQWLWYTALGHGTFYAERHLPISPKKRITIRMHRLIIDIPKGMVCDHIDGNGLNNQKWNLRAVTNRQNLQNMHAKKSSKHPGVYFQKRGGKWIAKIRLKGDKRQRYLGTFTTEKEAAEMYLAYSKIIEGTSNKMFPRGCCYP